MQRLAHVCCTDFVIADVMILFNDLMILFNDDDYLGCNCIFGS